jgi:hypothetical protein
MFLPIKILQNANLVTDPTGFISQYCCYVPVAPHSSSISEKKLAKELCERDIVQKPSSSQMIKTVHGSLAKPCIVLID